MSPRDLERGVAMLAELADDGVVDGIHLEGPWLAEARCGAHDPTILRDPTLAEVERLIELGRGHLRQVTLAPERNHGLDLVRWLTAAGIHAAVGHTTATYAQVEEAVAAGADLGTHLFNGMDPWHHRKPGAVAALMRSAARGHVTVELIATGCTCPTTRCAPSSTSSASTTSPSSPTRWLPPGWGTRAYVLGGLSVVVDHGVAGWLATQDGTTPGSIAGGTSHVADIVTRVVAAGTPLAYAVRPATRTPARALGLTDRGSLAAGSRADVVVVDANARPTRVMRRGRWLEAALPLARPVTSPRWSTAVFDLDGTLADTINLIVESYQHAFRTILGHEEDPTVIRSWIGRPLLSAFRDHSPEQADELYATYLQWNADNTERLIRGYDGVREVLGELRAAGAPRRRRHLEAPRVGAAGHGHPRAQRARRGPRGDGGHRAAQARPDAAAARPRTDGSQLERRGLRRGRRRPTCSPARRRAWTPSRSRGVRGCPRHSTACARRPSRTTPASCATALLG